MKNRVSSASGIATISLAFLSASCGGGSASVLGSNPVYSSLPGITKIQASRSDIFLVDVQYIDAGIPFKGRRANTPHQGAHIHFHIQQKNQNNFMAPALFTSGVVDGFYARWGIFANDGATPMPSSMGYMLDADENPFGSVAVDVLK